MLADPSRIRERTDAQSPSISVIASFGKSSNVMQSPAKDNL